jgi:hypothetical protein
VQAIELAKKISSVFRMAAEEYPDPISMILLGPRASCHRIQADGIGIGVVGVSEIVSAVSCALRGEGLFVIMA